MKGPLDLHFHFTESRQMIDLIHVNVIDGRFHKMAVSGIIRPFFYSSGYCFLR